MSPVNINLYKKYPSSGNLEFTFRPNIDFLSFYDLQKKIYSHFRYILSHNCKLSIFIPLTGYKNQKVKSLKRHKITSNKDCHKAVHTNYQHITAPLNLLVCLFRGGQKTYKLFQVVLFVDESSQPALFLRQVKQAHISVVWVKL